MLDRADSSSEWTKVNTPGITWMSIQLSGRCSTAAPCTVASLSAFKIRHQRFSSFIHLGVGCPWRNWSSELCTFHVTEPGTSPRLEGNRSTPEPLLTAWLVLYFVSHFWWILLVPFYLTNAFWAGVRSLWSQFVRGNIESDPEPLKFRVTTTNAYSCLFKVIMPQPGGSILFKFTQLIPFLTHQTIPYHPYKGKRALWLENVGSVSSLAFVVTNCVFLHPVSCIPRNPSSFKAWCSHLKKQK